MIGVRPGTVAFSEDGGSPRRSELRERYRFVAEKDPWAAKVKEDVLRSEEHTALEKEKQRAKAAYFREELERQIAEHKDAQRRDREAKRHESEEQRRMFEGYVCSKQSHKNDKRSRHRHEQEERDEQLRQLNERRKAEAEAAEREAAALRDTALQQLEEHKAQLRAKRRKQQETAHDTLVTNARIRRDKLRQKEEQAEEDRRLMAAQIKAMDDADTYRREQQERHRPKPPLVMFATSDRFAAPKYQSYFAKIEEEAEAQRRTDEERELAKKAQQKQTSRKVADELKRQLDVKDRERRAQRSRQVEARIEMEKDAADLAATQRSLTSSRRQRSLEHRAALERQIAEAQQRELDQLANGPATARW